VTIDARGDLASVVKFVRRNANWLLKGATHDHHPQHLRPFHACHSPGDEPDPVTGSVADIVMSSTYVVKEKAGFLRA